LPHWKYVDGDKNANSKILGSIAYITSNDRFHGSNLVEISHVDSIEIRDTAAYIEPGSYSTNTTFGLFDISGGAQNLNANNLTSIGGAGTSISSQWQKSNVAEGSITASVGSIFTSTQGAQICKRYKDGVLTSEPLWPWPMNQRIIDAMIESGRASVDVTQTIEQMFGPIPNECKQSSSPPSPPGSLRVTSG